MSNIVDFGIFNSQKAHNWKFILKKRIGVNLSKVRNIYSNLQLIDILKLGIQMIESIHGLHIQGYTHQSINEQAFHMERHMKPQKVNCFDSLDDFKRNTMLANNMRAKNHMMGTDALYKDQVKSTKLILVGLNKVKPIWDEDKKHVLNYFNRKAYNENHSKYQSSNFFLGNELSRRDDILSIIYMMIYWYS